MWHENFAVLNLFHDIPIEFQCTWILWTGYYVVLSNFPMQRFSNNGFWCKLKIDLENLSNAIKTNEFVSAEKFLILKIRLKIFRFSIKLFIWFAHVHHANVLKIQALGFTEQKESNGNWMEDWTKRFERGLVRVICETLGKHFYLCDAASLNTLRLNVIIIMCESL